MLDPRLFVPTLSSIFRRVEEMRDQPGSGEGSEVGNEEGEKGCSTGCGRLRDRGISHSEEEGGEETYAKTDHCYSS